MKTLFLGRNIARDIADWMMSQGEEVIYREDKITADDVKELSPDFIISYNYKYIISKEIIDCVKGKAIILHISFLPYNRGSHPNIWSFLEANANRRPFLSVLFFQDFLRLFVLLFLVLILINVKQSSGDEF